MTLPYRYFGAFRLLLALLVAFQHFAANVAPLPLARAAEGYATGSVAALGFFCLSGFVIAEAADMCYRRRPWAFAANRLLRIMPHFALAMTLSILVHWILFTHGVLYAERNAPVPAGAIFSLSNVLLNGASILPGIERALAYPFIHIVWAIRIEMAFYGVVAACLWGASRWRRPPGWMMTAALMGLSPCFALSLSAQLPHLFGFTPYFAYGAGLYFAWQGRRPGQWIALASLPAMAVHFFQSEAYFRLHTGVDFLLLALLLAMMTWLARKKFTGWRNADRKAGQWTYPLYLYHHIIMVAVASVMGRSYGAFALGIFASLLFAIGMQRIIDPRLDRIRDRLREGKNGNGFFSRGQRAG